jgi:hypothetical protein
MNTGIRDAVNAMRLIAAAARGCGPTYRDFVASREPCHQCGLSCHPPRLIEPQVTLMKVPVIAPRSEAIIAAMFATSALIGSRLSKVPLPTSARKSSNGTPMALACTLNVCWTSGVSGDPADRRQITRTPRGPNSAANPRHKPSIAPHAVPG